MKGQDNAQETETQATTETTEVLDCTRCGACCLGHAGAKAYAPLLEKEESMFDPSVVIRSEGGFVYLRTLNDRRCVFLDGKPGESVSCRVYETRPHVCRNYERGSVFCRKVRREEGIQ